MFSRPLAFVLLALGCVTAAAGGAYVATRHNAADTVARGAASPAATAPAAAAPAPAAASAQPVAETEAAVSAEKAAPATAERPEADAGQAGAQRRSLDAGAAERSSARPLPPPRREDVANGLGAPRRARPR